MEPKTSEQSAAPVNFPIGKLIPNIPFQVYADADAINSSGLKDILRSPAHYYEHRYNKVEEQETDALLFGRLLHMAVLESQLFMDTHKIEPKFDKRTIVGKTGYAEWKESLKPNAVIVPEKFVDALTGISRKIMTHPITKNVLKTGARETTLFWSDNETGDLCKARPDFVNEDGLEFCIDLKTTRDAREETFIWDIKKYKYDLQAAHYCNGLQAAGLQKRDKFIIIAIEKESPYEINVLPLGISILAYGYRQRQKAMRLYSECRKKNFWPGYNHKAKTLEYPDSIMERELFQEDEDET